MTKGPDLAHLREMSEAMQVPLYQRYSDAEAAKILDVSAVTMKRLRLEGQVAYVRISVRKVCFFGYQLLQHLIDSTQEATCPPQTNKDSKSDPTGSHGKHAAPPGAAPGTTPALTKQDALASAQRILGSPNKD